MLNSHNQANVLSMIMYMKVEFTIQKTTNYTLQYYTNGKPFLYFRLAWTTVYWRVKCSTYLIFSITIYEVDRLRHYSNCKSLVVACALVAYGLISWKSTLRIVLLTWLQPPSTFTKRSLRWLAPSCCISMEPTIAGTPQFGILHKPYQVVVNMFCPLAL